MPKQVKRSFQDTEDDGPMTSGRPTGVHLRADPVEPLDRHARLIGVRLACRRAFGWTGSVGVSKRVRRVSTTVAIALALAVTGAASTAGRGGSVQAQLVTATSDRASGATAPASVTAVDPTSALGQPGSQYAPAIHIAASGPAVTRPVQVDVADVLLDAYRSAVGSAPATCRLPVSLLAAIGEVESGSLAGRPIDAQHRTSVLGPVLDGHGFAAIPDTDNGKWDGSARWDRAVGPMQFIPSTWRTFGVDGDGDGVADPQDVEDAAASTAGYLCFGGRDLSRPADVRAAVLSYNHSAAYLDLVSTYQARYADLGLDDPTASGTPTTISLIATPVAAPMATSRAIPAATPGAPHRAVTAAARPHTSKASAHVLAASATTHRTGTKATQAGATRTGSTTTAKPGRPAKPGGRPTPAGTPSPGATGTPPTASGGQTGTPGSHPTPAPTPTGSDPGPTGGSTPPGGTTTGDPACAPAQDAAAGQPAAEPSPSPTDPATPDAAQCPPCDAPADGTTGTAAPGESTTDAPAGSVADAPAADQSAADDGTCAPATEPSPSAAP